MLIIDCKKDTGKSTPMEIPSSSLVFTVERSEPELIPPSRPTPYEFKYLSDLDDRKPLRKNASIIQFYRSSERMNGRDPVKVIKEAIAKTLVPYYPFAGRLVEGSKGKLMVECSGEGVLFIEAKASVILDEFGDALNPPFPGIEDLMHDVPGPDSVLHCPLLLIQVTRLRCGGFVLASRLNHNMCDATGYLQFLTAVGEMARGAHVPSVKPIWERQLLTARDPPKISCLHHEYEVLNVKDGSVQDTAQLEDQSFFFGLKEIADLRERLPMHLRMCSKVEIVVACIWRCRVIALGLDLGDETRLALSTSIHTKLNPPLPVGFYGNAYAEPVAITTAGDLLRNPLAYAVELIQGTKAQVTEEFIRSAIDFLVKMKPDSCERTRTFNVSDLTKMRFVDVDFGWGKAEYGGPIWGNAKSIFLISSRNNKGEVGIVATITLPKTSMEKFGKEIENAMRSNSETRSTILASAL